MRVVLFGATGMVGQGVLRECLLSSDVLSVTLIGRSASGIVHEKLREILHADLSDYSAIQGQMDGFDACFFCLGVSSGGMSEAEYTRITYGFTLAAAHALLPLNSRMVFIYVSGAGTDSSEQGRTMWARVKGRIENDLLRMGFRDAYMFRPGAIQPLQGIRSKTPAYRIAYAVLGPLLPLLRALFPNYIVTTSQVGQAMLNAVRKGYSKKVLEPVDIRVLSGL